MNEELAKQIVTQILKQRQFWIAIIGVIRSYRPMGVLAPTLVIFLLLLPLSAQGQTKVDMLTQVKNAGADMPYVGPNPWYDVRSFGARMVTTPPSTTATISSGSAVARLAAASTFKNGDGVVVRGAGPTPTMPTPNGPKVTPSNASTTTGTGVFVANASGATTYQYQVAAVDVLRGVTIASSATSISNGPATLGSQTVNVSSWTRTNNVVTVTTASAHNLVVGAGFSVTGDATLAGTYNIATVPDNTHFTFLTGLDTRNGALTVGGNTGIVTYYLANHISIAHVAGAQMYLIYGRAAGSMTLLGATLPDSGLTTDQLYNTWDDYGSPMTSIVLGDWAATTPPVAVKNEDLVTTIVSGAGTTTVTLANTASSTATTQNFLFDNTIAVIAAMVAARDGAGIVYIPCGSAANTVLVLNAVLNVSPFPSYVSIRQCGGVSAVDTIKIGQTIWEGERSPAFGGSFTFDNYPTIVSSTAYPVIASMGPWKMQYITLKQISPDGVIWVDDRNGSIPGWQMRNVNFISGGTADYLGRHFIVRTDISGGADVLMDHVAMTPGTGVAPTPLLVDTEGLGDFVFSHIMLNHRALYFGASSNGIGPGLIQNIYCQGCTMPKITLENNSGAGNAGVSLDINGSIEDTTNLSLVASGTNLSGVVRIFGTNGVIGPLTTGSGSLNYQLLSAGGGAQNISDNIGVVNGPYGFTVIDGILAPQTPTSIPQEKFDAHLSMGTAFQAFINSLAQVAPTCSVSAGGAVSIGSKTFVVFPVFSTGGEGTPSPVSATCTTSSGQQTVRINWTAVPGAIGYNIYANGFSIQNTTPLVSGGNIISYVWTAGGGGKSQSQTSGSGPTVMEAGGIHANKAFLSSSAGTGVATLDPTSITSNHTYTFPDSSGTLLVGVTPTGNRVSVSGVYTNATTTPSNITGLSFSAVANTTYGMTCQIYYQGSVSTAGLDITITGPASPASVFYSYDEHPTGSSVTTSVANAFATKLLGNAAVTTTTNLHAIVTLGLVNGANAGTVQVQGSATGKGTVTVQPGSFCTL